MDYLPAWRVKVHGAWNVPGSGPVILAANHIGLLDGPALVALTRRLTFAMVKREAFTGAVGQVRCTWVRSRRTVERSIPEQSGGQFRCCVRARCSRYSPKEHELAERSAWAKGGAAYLAMVSGAPIVPVAILGTREPGQYKNQVPRLGGPIHVVYGEPFNVPRSSWPRRKAAVAKWTEVVRQRLADHVVAAQAGTGLPLPGPPKIKPPSRPSQPVVAVAGRRIPSEANMSDVATAEELQVLPGAQPVGRPNVGKSTLVNRMLGRREAVVQDVPGVTRDRVSYDATWNGRQFVLVDSGGWAPDAKGMAARVTEQAELAVAAADAVVFVVDATVGTQDIDEAVVKVLRRSGKPVILAANKVDDQRTQGEAAAMWQLGLGEPFPVSALHGRGSGDLLDAILATIPEAPRSLDDLEGGPRRVAIVGKPNVGKSSLLNKIAGQQRAVVDEVRGNHSRSRR